MKRVGLLGGTFDPPHFGHINLGLEMQEKQHLDEIILCPAASSPFKVHNHPIASKEQRLQMVRMITEELPGWRTLDWEVTREGPSYTIDTVRALYADAELRKEKIEVYLVISQDLVGKLEEWKEFKQLLELAPPLIGIRREGSERMVLSDFLEKICQKGLTPTRVFDISSTLVRDRLKKGLYCGHLVPAKILDFIYHYQLYLN